MSGEMDLTTLLRSMTPVLQPGVFVFATLAEGQSAPNAIMSFIEAEGTTAILPQEDAQGLAAEFPCRMITLTVHSALEAVGFLARITAALAAEQIPTNTVSAFHHDHLFVPVDRTEDAMAILKKLSNAG